MAYTSVFGGELIFPSQLSFIAITTDVDAVLQWPTEQQITGNNVVADFINFAATAPGLNVAMPSALVASTGNKTTFNNIGANAFTVRDSIGGTIQTVQPGEQWVLVLTNNTTAAGTWSTLQLGASVSVASASALAGAGIKAIGVLLNQKISSSLKAATPFTVVNSDRAQCLIYSAGAGTCNLPNAATVGADWFFMLRNSGSGTLNVVPPSGAIDSSASINLAPNDSCFIFTDGANFFTVGLSSGSTIAFDFVSIPVPGSGDFTLSGANLNRIAYRFTGALTGDRRIVVPGTTQQYWVDNQTTGAFALTISTLAQVGPPAVAQGQSAILYCDGTNVINATNAISVTYPITIGQGGTGATTAGGALTNLGAVPTSRILTAGSGLSGGGNLSADRSFAVDINGLAADPTPDPAADYLMSYDASAAALKKVLAGDVGGGVIAGVSPTNFDFTNQGTNVAVTGAAVSVVSGRTYLLEVFACVESTTAGYTLSLGTPTSALGFMQGTSMFTGTHSGSSSRSLTLATGGVAAAEFEAVGASKATQYLMSFYLAPTANGVVQMYIAQATADLNQSLVLAGSYVRVTRLS